MIENDLIIKKNDPILITGSTGFIGIRLIATLLCYGFINLRCLVRSSTNLKPLYEVLRLHNKANVEIIEGNLLRIDDCLKAADNVFLIYHLAAGRGDKSYSNAFLNSVVTTRNLLQACLANKYLKRFVNVSSFAVYSNHKIRHKTPLDESFPMEARPEHRGEAYCYAKVKQDELVLEYVNKFNIPYVIVRPGAVYGPGNKGLTGRVGIGTFGVFLHLGGSNMIPLSYVDNCADAIVQAGLKKNINGEIINIIDDDLLSSRKLLRLYKKNVGGFFSIYLPHPLSFLLCYFWEKYSEWSKGQLPPVFNRNRWAAYWKGNYYSNQKLHDLLGWTPKVNIHEALKSYFEYQNISREK